jgi:signal transduction histidine kinase
MNAGDSADHIPPLRLLSRRRLSLVAAGALALVVLACLAGSSAHEAVGTPFPSLLVDPFGSYSAVYLPSWGTPTVADGQVGSVRFPDRLVAIDGVPLAPPRRPDRASREIGARIAALAASGRREVRLTFEHAPGQRLDLRQPIRRLRSADALFFFGLYAVVAMLVLWSAVMVLALAHRRSTANAYAFWSAGAVLFLLTFFDYHTTTRFVPLFTLSVMWISAGYLGLAWFFPDPPEGRSQVALWAMAGPTLLGCAGWLVLGPIAGFDHPRFRVLAGYASLVAGFALVLALLARLRRGDAGKRRELRSALWGIAAVPALAGLGLALPSFNGVGVIHLLAPFLVPLIPLSIGYSLIRHNILATPHLLTPGMVLVPVTMGALAGAMVVGMVWHGVAGALGHERATSFALGSVAFVVLCVVGYRLAMRLFFTAATKFRPTIEQLSDALSSRGDGASIRQAIENAVRRWLPVPSVRVLDPQDLASVEKVPANHVERLSAGELIWTDDEPWSRRLLVPIRSLGHLRAVMLVSPKKDRALFTSEDMALLSTIASLGAVALHNAEVVEHLDALRTLQVGVTRDEKLRALGAVGAELSHEIMGPLGFFRFLLKRASDGQPLERDDIDTGQAEVERLERMLSNLRRFHPPSMQLGPVSVAGTANRALRLLGPGRLGESGVQVTVDVAEPMVVKADADAFLQVVYNLLKNAVDAVGERGSIVICSRAKDDGGCVLEVWDSGPGVPPMLEKSMFNPWMTTKPAGTGLGLAISYRIVRSLGWRLSYRRDGGRTCFAIDMRRERPADGSKE